MLSGISYSPDYRLCNNKDSVSSNTLHSKRWNTTVQDVEGRRGEMRSIVLLCEDLTFYGSRGGESMLMSEKQHVAVLLLVA